MTTNIYKTQRERVPKAYNGKTFEKFCIFYYYCALFKQCYLKKKEVYVLVFKYRRTKHDKNR